MQNAILNFDLLIDLNMLIDLKKADRFTYRFESITSHPPLIVWVVFGTLLGLIRQNPEDVFFTNRDLKMLFCFSTHHM